LADNVTLNSGSGGETLATDDIGGVQYQLIKLAFGALDTANVVTSTGTNPLPVALSDTDNTVLDNMDTSLNNIETAVQLIDNTVVTMGTDTYAEGSESGNIVAVVRNDALATLANTDNEFAPLQVNASGALFGALATVGSAAQAISLDGGNTDAGTIRVTMALRFSFRAFIESRQ